MNTNFPIRKTPLTQHQKLEKQAQRLVAQTFYGAMLKQMRESPFKSEIFDGGRGGQAFSELLDQHLSEKMASGTHNQLVHSIVHKFETRSQSVVQHETFQHRHPGSEKVRSANPASSDDKGPAYRGDRYQKNLKRRNNESFSLRA